MIKKKKIFDYILRALIVIYIILFLLFAVLNWTGVMKDDGFPYMLKKVIELGPAFVLAFFLNEVMKKNRELNKKISNLEGNGVYDIFPDGVTTDLDSDDFFKCKIIKVCLVTGVGFLNYHRERILEGLKNGTEIRLLFAREDSAFIADNNNMLLGVSYEGENAEKNLCKEIIKTRETIYQIRNDAGEKGNNLKFGQYSSEYRDKYILRYGSKNGVEQIDGYINMTVPVRGPQDSVLFYCNEKVRNRENYVMNGRNRKKGNIVFDMELHFDYLWNMYHEEEKTSMDEMNEEMQRNRRFLEDQNNASNC